MQAEIGVVAEEAWERMSKDQEIVTGLETDLAFDQPTIASVVVVDQEFQELPNLSTTLNAQG